VASSSGFFEVQPYRENSGILSRRGRSKGQARNDQKGESGQEFASRPFSKGKSSGSERGVAKRLIERLADRIRFKTARGPASPRAPPPHQDPGSKRPMRWTIKR